MGSGKYIFAMVRKSKFESLKIGPSCNLLGCIDFTTAVDIGKRCNYCRKQLFLPPFENTLAPTFLSAKKVVATTNAMLTIFSLFFPGLFFSRNSERVSEGRIFTMGMVVSAAISGVPMIEALETPYVPNSHQQHNGIDERSSTNPHLHAPPPPSHYHPPLRVVKGGGPYQVDNHHPVKFSPGKKPVLEPLLEQKIATTTGGVKTTQGKKKKTVTIKAEPTNFNSATTNSRRPNGSTATSAVNSQSQKAKPVLKRRPTGIPKNSVDVINNNNSSASNKSGSNSRSAPPSAATRQQRQQQRRPASLPRRTR